MVVNKHRATENERHYYTDIMLSSVDWISSTF